MRGTRVLFFQKYEISEKLHTQNGPLELHSLLEVGFEYLQSSQAFLARLKSINRPDLLQKKKQGIYTHACGGMHFVQSILLGIAKSHTLKKRVKEQLDMLRFRWKAERNLYRSSRIQHPRYELLLRLQELKFFGHTLETLGIIAQLGVIDDNMIGTFAHQLVGDLNKTVSALLRFKSIVTQQQRYDLIGDGAHAMRGLNLIELSGTYTPDVP